MKLNRTTTENKFNCIYNALLTNKWKLRSKLKSVISIIILINFKTMILAILPRQVLVILLTAMYIDKEVNGSQTYVVSFQPEIKGSFAATTDSWMEYSAPISSSKEFTVCNWMKIKYFAINIPACTWAYCTIDIKEDKIKCTQMFFEAESATANRNLRFNTKIQLEHGVRYLQKSFDSYHHRTWFHVCWSWSTISGISKFYLNGNVLVKEKIHVTEKDWALYGC